MPECDDTFTVSPSIESSIAVAGADVGASMTRTRPPNSRATYDLAPLALFPSMCASGSATMSATPLSISAAAYGSLHSFSNLPDGLYGFILPAGLTSQAMIPPPSRSRTFLLPRSPMRSLTNAAVILLFQPSPASLVSASHGATCTRPPSQRCMLSWVSPLPSCADVGPLPCAARHSLCEARRDGHQ